MTKNEAKRIAKLMGCEASYSGKSQTMFIKGKYAHSASHVIGRENPMFKIRSTQNNRAY